MGACLYYKFTLILLTEKNSGEMYLKIKNENTKTT